jgi:2-polyprenyl-3-methyl-5-hydroxy-6-metoxy-1,4-benzoquinol methylase
MLDGRWSVSADISVHKSVFRKHKTSMSSTKKSGSAPRPRASGTVSACKACGKARGRLYERLAKLPVYLFPMPEEVAPTIPATNVVLHKCESCGHIYQPRVDQRLLDVIYNEYYRYYPYDGSEVMALPYREPFHRFFGLIASGHSSDSARRLLEIGCSSASNLDFFSNQGFRCTGIDPSPLAQKDSGKANIEIVSGYYETTSFAEPFDVIVSRFNLEHVNDLSAHIDKIAHDVKTEGLVFVQVPNVDYYYSTKQPFFVAHEHVQYFNLRSLIAAFRRFGFFPVSFYCQGQPSILASFSRGETAVVGPLRFRDFDAALSAFQMVTKLKARQLKKILRSCESVLFYGAGLALFWILLKYDEVSKRSVVVDDNPNVWGKFIPFYGMPVLEPSREVLAKKATVILTLNPFYHRRVIQRLKAFRIPMDVILLGRDTIDKVHLGNND